MTCDLLREVLEAHGGSRRWAEFARATARVKIGGEIWKKLDGPFLFADTSVEVLTQEELLTMVPISDSTVRSVCKPNSISIQTSPGEFVETRYNPNSSFRRGEKFETWDEFQLSYVFSYSIWNCLTQPFLFTYSGFEVEEIEPVSISSEQWRCLRVGYPVHIAGPTRELVVYVDEDALIRRLDFAHRALDGMRMTSVLSEYEDFQGFRLATRRKIFSSKELDAAADARPLTSFKLTDVEFR